MTQRWPWHIRVHAITGGGRSTARVARPARESDRVDKRQEVAAFGHQVLVTSACVPATTHHLDVRFEELHRFSPVSVPSRSCRVGRVFTRPTATVTPVGLVKTRPTLLVLKLAGFGQPNPPVPIPPLPSDGRNTRPL